MISTVKKMTHNIFNITVRGTCISMSSDQAKELARQLVRETDMPLTELLRQQTGGDQASKLREIAREVSYQFNTPITEIIKKTDENKKERLLSLAPIVGK